MELNERHREVLRHMLGIEKDGDKPWRNYFVASEGHDDMPALKIAVETEGKTHAIGAQHEKDCEKFAAELLQGWKVLRVTYKQVQAGQAIQWLQKLLTTSP